jgi:hypothetical protein
MARPRKRERDNADRVWSGRRAVESYDGSDPDDLPTSAADLIADLLHLIREQAERAGASREDAVAQAEDAHGRAWRHFWHESLEDERY